MRKQSVPQEHRATPRKKVLLRARIQVGTYRFDVRVRDLSLGGLRLSDAPPLAPGTALYIEIDRFGRFPAIVVWSYGDLLGLQFIERRAQAQAKIGEFARRLGLDGGPQDES